MILEKYIRETYEIIPKNVKTEIKRLSEKISLVLGSKLSQYVHKTVVAPGPYE